MMGEAVIKIMLVNRRAVGLLLFGLMAPMYVDAASFHQKKQPLLVVLVQFADAKLDYGKDDFRKLFFTGKGAVQHYFLDNSYNQFKIEPALTEYENSVLLIDMSINHPRCRVGECGQSVETVLRSIDSQINFKTFDDAGNGDGNITEDELSVLLVFSGYEGGLVNSRQPAVRSHHKTLNRGYKFDEVFINSYTILAEKTAVMSNASNISINSLGRTVHELGHLMLDLPDLYNAAANDQYPEKIADASVDYQIWGVMAGGLTAGKPKGSKPVQLSGYSKLRAGFVQPRDIQQNALVTLRPLHKQPDLARVWLDPYQHRQFLLLEYRDDPAFGYFNHSDRMPPVANRAAYQSQGLLVSKVDPWAKDNNSQDQKLILPLLGRDGNMLSASDSSSLTMNARYPDLINVTVSDLSMDDQNEALTVNVQMQGDTTKASVGLVDGIEKILGTYRLNPANFIVQMDVKSVQWVDGIDLYLSNAKEVTIKLASTLVVGNLGRAVWGNELYQQSFSLLHNPSGWTRLMFDRPVAVSDYKQLLVFVDMDVDGSIGYLSGKRQGVYFRECGVDDRHMPSSTSRAGRQVITWGDGNGAGAKPLMHDLAVRLLVERSTLLPNDRKDQKQSRVLSERPVADRCTAFTRPISAPHQDTVTAVNPTEGSEVDDQAKAGVSSQAQQQIMMLTQQAENGSVMDSRTPGPSGGALVPLWLLILLPLVLIRRLRCW